MTVQFDEADLKAAAEALKEATVNITPQRIADVLYNVEAAFVQQLQEEIEYMVAEFETGN